MSALSMYSSPDENDELPANVSLSSAADEDEFVVVPHPIPASSAPGEDEFVASPHPIPDSLSFAVESGGTDEGTAAELRSGLTKPTPAKGVVRGLSWHRELSSIPASVHQNNFIILHSLASELDWMHGGRVFRTYVLQLCNNGFSNSRRGECWCETDKKRGRRPEGEGAEGRREKR